MTQKNAPANRGESSNYQSISNFNSTSAQRHRLSNWLYEHGSITTIQARKHLDILSPASRILELRKQGFLITTIWSQCYTEHGRHRVARYVLRDLLVK
jgi:hypothetical protein